MKRSNENKIKVLFVGVGKAPEVREIEPTLYDYQMLVGGDKPRSIQSLPLAPGLVAYMDEEGRYDQPLNILIPTIVREHLALGKKPDVIINATGAPLPKPGSLAYWDIHGNFFVTRIKRDDEVSLTDKDIEALTFVFGQCKRGQL